jgi:uncharacterized protein YbjT (DUF2867 family)
VRPIVSDDAVAALADIALGKPANATVEVAGPEEFPLDELVRRVFRRSNDPREITADRHARYFGAELTDQSLVPGSNPRLGSTRFDTWLASPGSAQP